MNLHVNKICKSHQFKEKYISHRNVTVVLLLNWQQARRRCNIEFITVEILCRFRLISTAGSIILCISSSPDVTWFDKLSFSLFPIDRNQAAFISDTKFVIDMGGQ